MYNGLLHAHSGLRWIALLLLLVAIFNAFRAQSSGQYLKKDKMINLFAMVMLHIQLLIGLGMYFQSPKVQFVEKWMSDGDLRFFGMEHFLGMLIAIIIITMGRSKAEKKLKGSRDKHRKIMISYLIGLIIILISIPWPFSFLGHPQGAWF
jgi:ABC-type xylose transport system permease subunit